MRALLVVSNLEYGGAQRQIVQLANEVDGRRCEIEVCSLSRHVPLAEDLRGHVRLHIVPKRAKFDLTVVWRLARLLRRLQADVVHGFLFDADIAARLAGLLAGTEIIVGSERNADYHLKRRQLLAYRTTRRLVDLVVANSRAGARFNARVLGYPESVYRVVHNGVDTSHFRPHDAAEGRAGLGLSLDVPLVGMFASFKPQKNHALFFRAAKRVLARHPRARFLLVGDELYGGLRGSSEYKRAMQRLIADLGLQEACIFLGNTSSVSRLYAACDLTVLPSHHEGTPNVLLESMACGVPVVATDVADNAFVVPDRVVGRVVPPGDEIPLASVISELLEDREARLRLGTNARTWVTREFSTGRLVERMIAAYQEALARKRTASRWGRLPIGLSRLRRHDTDPV